MFVAASFKQEMEDLVPERIMSATAIPPDVRRKVCPVVWELEWVKSRRDGQAHQLAPFPGTKWQGAMLAQLMPGQRDVPASSVGTWHVSDVV